MKRLAMVLLAASILAGCGTQRAQEPPSPAKDASAPPPAADETRKTATMTGINLYLHNMNATDGAAEKPAFWVQAEEFSQLDNGAWTFSKAHAVVYSPDEQGEDIAFDANSGEFKEEERAYMNNGVTANVGTIRMDLQDIEWKNDTREALTENPVHLVDGKTELDAASLRILPDAQTFTLTKVKGVIQLKKEAQ